MELWKFQTPRDSVKTAFSFSVFAAGQKHQINKQFIQNIMHQNFCVVGPLIVSSVCDCMCVCCCVLILHVNVGVISADNEDEAQRPEEASDGEIQGRGGP